MQSKATTVDAYLAELPDDRRAAIQAVRQVMLANLDPDFEEGIGYGMIGYCVPHRLFPPGYHCDPDRPLPFAALASQKNHMSLYLMFAYDDSDDAKWLRAAWQRAGKKLDMGKCCIRFKKIDDVPLDVLAEACRRVPARAWAAHYAALLDPSTGRPRSSRSSDGSAAAAKGKAAAKKKGKTTAAPLKKAAGRNARVQPT